MTKDIYKKELKAVYKNDNLVIYEPDQNGIMLSQWSGFLTASIARTGCLALLDALDLHPCTKVLNCNQKVTGHHAGAIEWVGKVWFPGMYSRGVRYFAWVYSPEFYAQIGTDEVISFNTDVIVDTFYSMDSAYQWLAEK